MYYPHWSIFSAIFFTFLGIIASYIIKQEKKRSINGYYSMNNTNIIFLIFLWTIIASFRLVKGGIGGTDTPGYIEFFQYCNTTDLSFDKSHAHVTQDLGYYWLNKILSFVFMGEYHCYFIIVNSLMVFSYAYLYKYFVPVKTNYIPLILTIFVFYCSMSSLRSSLSISFLLLAIAFYVQGKFRGTILMFFMSLLNHKFIVLYALSLPLYHFIIKRYNINILVYICLFFLSSGLSLIATKMLQMYVASLGLEGAYAAYLSKQEPWITMYGLYGGQALLGIAMILRNKSIKKFINEQSGNLKIALNLLYFLCFFDVIMIPMNGAMNNYRAYEIFYLLRLIMWGIILYTFTRNKVMPIKFIVNMIAIIVFVGWMLFRFNKTCEGAGLLPYYFAPFVN